MSNTPDISRIIQLIMENPGLIEEISNLAKADSESTVPETKPEPTIVLEYDTKDRGNGRACSKGFTQFYYKDGFCTRK